MIMAMVTQRVELSCALNSWGDRAKRCPAINNKVQQSLFLSLLTGQVYELLANSLSWSASESYQTTCSLSRNSNHLPL